MLRGIVVRSGIKDIAAVSKEAAQEAMMTYLSCARSALSATGGYECKEVQTIFAAAFESH